MTAPRALLVEDSKEFQLLGRRLLEREGFSVTVADNGPGLAPDLVQKLHTPFFSTKPTGSGLGLTICAQIIKAHGGVFEARNRDEGGAEFSFILSRPKDEENGARL